MADAVTDLTGDVDDSDDGTITCKRCTFLNSIYLNNCELCETPLRRDSELNIDKISANIVDQDNTVNTQAMNLVDSLQHENAALRKQMQDLRAVIISENANLNDKTMMEEMRSERKLPIEIVVILGKHYLLM